MDVYYGKELVVRLFSNSDLWRFVRDRVIKIKLTTSKIDFLGFKLSIFSPSDERAEKIRASKVYFKRLSS